MLPLPLCHAGSLGAQGRDRIRPPGAPRGEIRVRRSLVVEGRHRIDLCSAARRERAGAERDETEQRDGRHHDEWIEGVDVVELARHGTTHENRADQPESNTDADHRGALRKNQPEQLPPTAAEGHADAELPRALRDVVGEDSVDTDCREEEAMVAKPSAKSIGVRRGISRSAIRSSIV